MIPREILKKIRQIELRTNRLVTAFAAGARASARFTARPSAASKSNPALNSIRTLKRRERHAPDRLLLTPGFSPVIHDRECLNRFNGFSPAEKPLKRLNYVRLAYTGLQFHLGLDSLERNSVLGILLEVSNSTVKFGSLFRREFPIVSVLNDVGPNLLCEFETVGAA